MPATTAKFSDAESKLLDCFVLEYHNVKVMEDEEKMERLQARISRVFEARHPMKDYSTTRKAGRARREEKRLRVSAIA
jgi:hypothetical protein